MAPRSSGAAPRLLDLLSTAGVDPSAWTERWAAGEEQSSVAEVVAEALSRHGVTKVFGIPGIHNLALWFALGKVGIDRVLVRHEQAALYAADGYYRATGRLGVCLTTSGPGAANTAGATGEALTSGSAVLHITTSTPLALRHKDPSVRRGTVHDLPFQSRVFEPLVKTTHVVEAPDDAGLHVLAAIGSALDGWRGPTYLEFPADLLSETVRRDALIPEDAQPADAVGEQWTLPSAAATALTDASDIVIWAGYGAMDADVAALAEHLAAPVVTTLMGRAVIDSRHPLAAGMAVHEPAVTALVESAGLVLALGTDFDGQNTQNWRLQRRGSLVRVDILENQLTVNATPDVAVHGRAEDFVPAVLAEVPAAALDRRTTAEQSVERVRDAVRSRLATDPRDAAGSKLVETLAKSVPDDVAVVADMTMAGYWAAAYLPRALSRTFMYPMGWGTLGYGLPLAVGVAHATQHPVVLLSGDAGLLFNVGELATLAERRLSVVVVVFNDRSYGVLAYGMADEQATEMRSLTTPDFPALARSFGIPAEAVSLDQLGTVLAAALDAGGPHLIEVGNVEDPPVSIVARWPLKSRD